ncbi:MAG: 4Fe-4S binding protein [Deltaproteobacteria bacterium]|nr:4Fe-4S binding protein [Deltaproteobacteria bacterium]
MLIDKEKCIGCEECHPYCPVQAILTIEGEDVSEVDQEECVECGACLRSEVCPADAIYMPQLEWPRSVRAFFSDPQTKHPTTDLEGRGTEEMKTNDVTCRFPSGIAGVGVEMGRPGVGTSLRDLQTVAMALAKVGVEFEPENPTTALMADPKKGRLKEEVINEKVLSAIIEFSIENSRLKDALEAIKEAATKIDTVFSLCLTSRVGPGGDIPTVPIAMEAGFRPRVNTKTNVGLGRPLKKEC